jgi:ribosomal protein L19
MSALSKSIVKKIREVPEKALKLRGGDTVWMEYRDYVDSQRFKTFTGICLGKSKKGFDETVVLRSVVGGVGVEFGFHSLSKNLKKLNVVESATKRGGRIKRNDLRQANMR